jgi:uncharacterized Zn finger protein
MSDLNMNAKVPLPCPNCGHKVKHTLTRIKGDPDLTCPKCGVTTKWNAKGLRKGLETTQKAIDDLKRALKGLK